MKRQLLHVDVEVLNMIKLELTVEDVNGILSALGKAPYELAHPIIEKIRLQGVPQVQALVTDVAAD